MNRDATRVTGPGTGGEKHAVSVTRMCLRSGTVQLPFALAGRLPAGELAAFDAEADAALELWSDPPRHVAGLTAFFDRHELQVNDQVTFELRGEDLRIGVVKRPRRSRPKVTPSSWDSLRDGPSRSRTFEPSEPEKESRSDGGHEPATAHEVVRPGAPGTEPSSTDAGPAEERPAAPGGRPGPDRPTGPPADARTFEPRIETDPAPDSESDPFAELRDDAEDHGLGGLLSRARGWFGGGSRRGGAHHEPDAADTFRRRTVDPEPERPPLDPPDLRAPTMRDQTAPIPDPPEESPRAPSPIRVRPPEPEPPERDRPHHSTADDGAQREPEGLDTDSFAEGTFADDPIADEPVADEPRPEPPAAEPEPTRPDPPPTRPRPNPERRSSERPSRTRPTAPWRVREARLRAAAESVRTDADDTDAAAPERAPEGAPERPAEGARGEAPGRGRSEPAKPWAWKATERPTDRTNERPTEEPATEPSPVTEDEAPVADAAPETNDGGTHAPERTVRPERPVPDRRFAARGSSDPERIRVGSDRDERATDAARPTTPDPLRRRPSRRAAEARSLWPDDFAHDRFDASDDDFLAPLGGATLERRTEPGASTEPPADAHAAPIDSEPESDPPEPASDPVAPRVPGVRATHGVATDDGDLRTRLARFLASPEMSLIAKVDVIARRFDLDDEVARELLSDIADDPPSGLRLTPVREGAWRIERTGT